MRKIIVSKDIYPELLEKLNNIPQYIKDSLCYKTENFNIEVMKSLEIFGTNALANHPDLCYCWLKSGEIFKGDRNKIGKEYPADCLYNACSTGRFFIHNLDITEPLLLQRAKELDLTLVHVKQGYSKCSIAVIDENSIITYDKGIAKACREAGMDVLEIESGFVELPGYNTGFFGGASGLLGGTSKILFINGGLESHPSAEKIKEFAKAHDVSIVDTSGPLRDIGSIIIE